MCYNNLFLWHFSLLNTCLVPYQLPAAERMKKLYHLLGTVDEHATKAFMELQKNQLCVRKLVMSLLRLLQKFFINIFGCLCRFWNGLTCIGEDPFLIARFKGKSGIKFRHCLAACRNPLKLTSFYLNSVIIWGKFFFNCICCQVFCNKCCVLVFWKFALTSSHLG